MLTWGLLSKKTACEANVKTLHIGIFGPRWAIYFIFFCFINLTHSLGSDSSEQIYSDPAAFIKSLPQLQQDPKLGSTLSDIVEGPSEAVPIRGIVSGNESNQTLLVDIYVNSSILNETALMPHLKEIKLRHRDLIEAEAYVKNITAIRDLPFVSYMDVPVKLENYDESNQCLLDTCPLLNFLKTKCPSRGGEGINLVVLDLGFYHNSLIDTCLPQKTIFEKTRKYSSNDLNDRHGTACSEIIGQIAPNVKLFQIYGGDSPDQMLNTIGNLKDLTDKIDIVSCSIGFKSGPGIFDIRDDLYYAIRNLTSSGTIWVNSAGNEAEKHWTGKFNDSNGDGFNNFLGKDQSINITLEKGTLLSVILVWNDWPDPNYGRSTQDYDLWVLGPKPEDTKYSKRPQKGHRNEFPQETIGNMIAPRDGIYQILIEKKNATANDTMFHIFVDSANNRIGLDEYNVSQSSLNAVARYDNVITVGALNTSSNVIKPYSSRGPTLSGQLKPDLVAPTDLQTVSYYPGPFTGTSAAAPVVAGCIALQLNENNLNKNTLNNNNLNSNNRDKVDNSKDVFIDLESHATDLGPKGPDNIYGYGLINMSFLNK